MRRCLVKYRGRGHTVPPDEPIGTFLPRGQRIPYRQLKSIYQLPYLGQTLQFNTQFTAEAEQRIHAKLETDPDYFRPKQLWASAMLQDTFVQCGLIDSGAQFCLIPRTTATVLNLEIGGRMQVVTASGVTSCEVGLMSLQFVEHGTQNNQLPLENEVAKMIPRLDDVPVVVSDQNIALFGAWIFHRLPQIDFDVATHRMRVRQTK